MEQLLCTKSCANEKLIKRPILTLKEGTGTLFFFFGGGGRGGGKMGRKLSGKGHRLRWTVKDGQSFNWQKSIQ